MFNERKLPEMDLNAVNFFSYPVSSVFSPTERTTIVIQLCLRSRIGLLEISLHTV